MPTKQHYRVHLLEPDDLEATLNEAEEAGHDWQHDVLADGRVLVIEHLTSDEAAAAEPPASTTQQPGEPDAGTAPTSTTQAPV